MYRLFALTTRAEFTPRLASTEWGAHLQIRLYSTQSQSQKLNFVFNILRYQDTLLIKQKRFGTQLEEFKKAFEAPCIETFAAIKRTRKWLGNRRGRNLVPRVLPIETVKRRKKIADRKEFIEREAEIAIRLQDYITTSRSPEELNVLGADSPEKRRIREAYFASLFENINFAGLKTRPQNAQSPPTKSDDVGVADKFMIEKKLSTQELAQLIASELEREFIEHDYAAYDQAQQLRLSQHNDPSTTHHRILDIALKIENNKDVLQDRPAIAVKPRKSPPERPKKPKIKKVSDLHPIAFESNSYPLDHEFYNPFHTRKVILYVKVNALGLPTLVKERFVGLAQQRDVYDSGKDLVILRSQKKRSQRANKQYLIRILRAMLAEAWKADLNYIPAPEELLPHELVEKELQEHAAKEELEKRNSFDGIKQQQKWTIFRMWTLPSPEELQNTRVAAKEYHKKTMEELVQ